MNLRYYANKPDLRPTRKHDNDAGIDLYSAEHVTVPASETCVVHTGVYFDIPEGTMLLIKPKSRHDFLIGAGVIDAGYQGEILVKVVNIGCSPIVFSEGEPVAQAVHLPVLCYPLVDASSVDNLFHVKSGRGATGGIVGQ